MIYEEIRTKQDLSYISIYSLSILYNSKFILMATSLGTNAVVVTRVHCISFIALDKMLFFQSKSIDTLLFSPQNICWVLIRTALARCFKPPVVYSTDHSKAVVPVLVLLFGPLWFILRGDLLYVLACAILFLCFSVLLAL